MQAHHRSSAVLIAFLLIPFGVAIVQDAKSDKADPYGLDPYGYGGYEYDDVYGSDNPYLDEDYEDLFANDYDDEAYQEYQAELLAELAAYDDYDDYDYDEVRHMGASFFDDVFLDGGKGKAPLLVGPFAGIKFGQSEEQLERQRPDYEELSYELPGHSEASADFEFDHDRLVAIIVRFPDDGSALRSLSTQWGSPTNTSDEYTTTSFWHNSKAGLQANLVSSGYEGFAAITLSPYQELSEFIGTKGKLFGFEQSDLLSLNKAAIGALRADSYYDDEIILRQPNLAGVSHAVEVIVTTEEDRVIRASVDIDLSIEKSKQLYKLIEAKMGRPSSKTGDHWGQTYTFKKSARVVTLQTDGEGWNSITITRK